MQDEVNQEMSEQDETAVTKKGADHVRLLHSSIKVES